MTLSPRVVEPDPDQADDVVAVELDGGWILIVTDGLAVLTHPAGVAPIVVEPGRA